MMVIHDQRIERCRQELGRELMLDDKELLDALVCHIFERDTKTSLEATLHTLVSEGRSLSNLLTSLVHCQLRHLEAITADLGGLQLVEQHVLLKRLVEHYADLQAECLKVAKKSYAKNSCEEQRQKPVDEERKPQARMNKQYEAFSQEQLQVPVEKELASQLEERTKEQWRKTGRIKLFNYFRGLLVVATTSVKSLEDYYVTVQLTRPLVRVFASGKKMRYAFTEIPDESAILCMEIFSRKNDLLTLRIVGMKQRPRSGRDQIRVDIMEDIPIALIRDGRILGDAWLLDLCDSGLCMQFEHPVELTEGDEVECVGTIRRVNLRALGVVRWIEPTESQTRLGVELRLTPGEQRELRSVLTGLEKEIIQRLNQLGTPETLR